MSEITSKTKIESVNSSINEVAEPRKPSNSRTINRTINKGTNTATEIFGKKFTTSLGNKVEVIFIPEGNDEYEVVFTVNDSYDDDATGLSERDTEILSGVIYTVSKIVDGKNIQKLSITPRSGKGDKKQGRSINRRESVYARLINRYMKDWNVDKSFGSFMLTKKTMVESFVGFVKSLDRGWNTSLIDAIVEGCELIFESDDIQTLFDELSDFVDSNPDIKPSEPPEPEKAPIKDGGTVVAYHGSNAVFDEFSKEKIGTNFPNTKDGFFFSDDLEYIDYLAKKLSKEKGGIPTLYKCQLDLGRTYTARNYFDTFSDSEADKMYAATQGDVIDIFDSYRDDIISKARSNNCNSIHFHSAGVHLYVVFESNQIKILDRSALTESLTESVDNIDSPELEKALSQDTFEDRVIAYLEKTGSEVFTVPTDAKLKELLASTMMKYITPDRIERVVKWTAEYDGMSVDELRAQSEQAKKDMRDEYMQMIQSKVELYKAAEAFIKSKDPSLTVDIPSMNSIIKDVLNIHNDEIDLNSCVLYVYKGNDKYDSIGLLVNPSEKTIEIFEENEESNQATISAVTALTKDPEEYVKVFSSQKTSVIGAIESTQTVPKEMFVSPDVGYAKKYLQEDRDIISFEIQYKYLNPHSQYDWQVNSDAPIRRFRYV